MYMHMHMYMLCGDGPHSGGEGNAAAFAAAAFAAAPATARHRREQRHWRQWRGGGEDGGVEAERSEAICITWHHGMHARGIVGISPQQPRRSSVASRLHLDSHLGFAFLLSWHTYEMSSGSCRSSVGAVVEPK